MTPLSCDRDRPARLSPEAAESLTAALIEEMIGLWERGERILTEQYLARFPCLREHPETIAELERQNTPKANGTVTVKGSKKS